MTDAGTTTVRDFIYVDVERVYSLYSQLFKGIVDRIVDSLEGSEDSTKSQRGPVLQGSVVESSVSELQRRTEVRVMYDEIYNRLENRISEGVIDQRIVDKASLQEILSKTPYIKATGPAEIEDMQRMLMFMKDFNEMGVALAQCMIASLDDSAVEENVEAQLAHIKDRNERAKAKAKAKKQGDRKRRAQELAKTMNLQQDPDVLAALNLFAERFGADTLDITITPETGMAECAVRARADRRWLRLQPDSIRALYGVYSQTPWTVFGHVTYLPGDSGPKPVGANPAATQSSETPSMRDPYRGMFHATGAFEKMFFESHSRFELIVHPLAIYREYRIELSAAE
jgi:hypothetical protein